MSQSPQADPALLEFLEVSSTRRDQVVARLGAPTTEFEPDRVALYSLDRDRSGYRLGWPDTGMPGGRFHLVMEFDERDVLVRYAILDAEAELSR